MTAWNWGHVALVARLIGEPARAAILVALVGGRALPAGELAFIGNVALTERRHHLGGALGVALFSRLTEL